MSKRKTEQFDAERAFKRARGEELQRFLTVCLEKLKKKILTNQNVTDMYYKKLLEFNFGIHSIAKKFTELKVSNPEIQHPAENDEKIRCAKHVNEDARHNNPAVVDVSLLLEKIITGLEYALEKKLYPQVQFCLSFLVCTRPNDFNCKKIRKNGDKSCRETHLFLHDVNYIDDTILGTLANLLPSKQHSKIQPFRLIPFICAPKHYKLVLEGFTFLQQKENIERPCYGGKAKFLKGLPCGPETVGFSEQGKKQDKNEWSRKSNLNQLMIETLGLADCLRNPEKCQWFVFNKTNARHFTACAVAQGILELDDDIMPSAAFRNSLGHELRSSADHSYDNIKCMNMPKYENILVKKIDPKIPLFVLGKEVTHGHYISCTHIEHKDDKKNNSK